MPIRFFVFVSLFFILNSCATVLNSPTKEISIHTQQKSTVTVNGEKTIANNNFTEFKYITKRDKSPLKIKIIQDDKDKEIRVSSFYSFAFWLNIYNYGVGMIIDAKNPKAFTYPKHIYIDSTYRYGYRTFIPEDPIFYKRNVLKLSPAKLYLANYKGIEFSYERFLKKKYSVQFNGAYLTKSFKDSKRGVSIGIENRYYFYQVQNVKMYTSLELEYIKNKISQRRKFINSDSTIYPGYLNVFYEKFHLVPKIGSQFKIAKNFVIDIFVGVRIGKQNIHHYNKNNNYHTGEYNIVPFIDLDKYKNEGRMNSFDYSGNVKIGYTF